ncbi:hypothetical protein [Conexibacter sp. CPCC 206217]|uniref:hypothetical protein n=1 Tax=Conexibacter sp. CPCC 206217 TaxID=3064574 RepID=UPI00271A23C5|nr:hypothetical protein [Conexibacter sp. CPCC 206217]MDO8211592.1 hypothetical protein [Conexibacter sp. CPCC 206217]
MRKFGALAATAACAILIGAAPAAAGIWSEVPTGTSSAITAIEYQSDARLWFTTASGEIWRRRADLSGFERVYAGGVPLNDVEFQQGGSVGLAVGVGGTVVRSTDGGGTWARVTGIPVSNVGDGSANQCTISERLGDVNFVRFAGPTRVWIGGPERQIATSQTGDPATVGATGTWIDANRKVPPVARDNCWIEQKTGFADMFAASPDVFYLQVPFWDTMVFSTDDLRSEPTGTAVGGANGMTLAGVLAGDPASPNRMWSVTPSPYGNSTAQYTEDAWASSQWFHLADDGVHGWPGVGPFDVAYNGGTVLAVGNSGFVIQSTNGRDFEWNGADGALAANDWRAVGLASGTQAAIGGASGKLMLTTSANVLPSSLVPPRVDPPVVVPPVVTPPVIPIAPPVRRAVVTPRGGDATPPPNVSGGSTTQTTGGARLTLWKRIALSRGRYVPVRISARTPRRFVIEIRRSRRPRTRIAMAKARLGRNGRKLVKVPLRADTRTGTYRVVVRVYQGRRAIGRRLSVAIVVTR